MSADGRASEEIRPATVHRAYGRYAAGFDAYVRAIPGYHASLRVSASRMGLSGSGLRLLDVGCGTGASTEALLTAVPGSEVVAVDASAEMLAIARKKNWPPRVTFVQSRLETLGEAEVTGPFDGILASYLVSNLPDAEIGLRRLLSLLAPGAPLAVHDYAVAGARGRSRWASASWGWLLPMASVRWGGSDLARFRYRRVRGAGGPESMVHRMERAGFDDVRVQTVGGLQQHLVHTFLGRRPDEPDVVAERARARAAAGRDDTAGEPVEEGGPEDPGYADELPADHDGYDDGGYDEGEYEDDRDGDDRHGDDRHGDDRDGDATPPEGTPRTPRPRR